MIVKVQVDRNIFSGCGRFCGRHSARIYNEDLSINWIGHATKEMENAAKGLVFGKFFHARLDATGEIVLDEEAPWQEWECEKKPPTEVKQARLAL